MTRTLRKLHRMLWPLLAAAIGIAFGLALAWKKPAHAAPLSPPSAVLEPRP